MDPVLVKALKIQMQDARALADPERRLDATITVLCHQNDAIMDCQSSLSEAFKRIEARDTSIKDQFRGAAIMVELLKYIAQLGGVGIIVKLITGGN